MNSNIRCIEIINIPPHFNIPLGWIVTLDVLKWFAVNFFSTPLYGWIVTLDVLKLRYLTVRRNKNGGWIVTLDVLKCSYQ